jgi:hypothetical protein
MPVNKMILDKLKVSKLSQESYQKSADRCKCGCIIDKDGNFIVSNAIWIPNQLKLWTARSQYSHAEKDKIMKDAMYHKLKEKKVISKAGHISLTFTMQLEIDTSGTTEPFSFCESCFVNFNNHRCKFPSAIMF